MCAGRGSHASAVGHGIERAGLTAELEQSGKGRDIDAKPSGNLTPGALAVVDRIEDTFAEIVR
jgi:hypothetical protein